MTTRTFACYSLNEAERSNSSSGGIYPLLAKEVIQSGGIVYAACFNEKLEVIHKPIEREKDITYSQGSKYVQSSLSFTFQNIISELRKGRKVLFVGTPCQCAGLNSLILFSKVDRSNLVLVDFVCHGVPGRKAWNAYKESYKKMGNELASVNMRDKSSGWTNGNYSWKETTTDGKTIITPRRKNAFMRGMLANLYLRPSCFECRFKGLDRCTDITLGDYWGVWKYMPEMDDNKGTSLVIVHTDQGLHLFYKVRESLKVAEADIEKATIKNSCIVESTKYNRKREEFFCRLSKGDDFISIVDILTKVSLINKLKSKVKGIIIKIVRKD